MHLISLLNIAFSVGWGCLLVLAYRWIRARSSLIGSIMAAGLLVRSLLGLALFWVSYLHLPVLRSLQVGNGFWALTPDAKGYYDYAAAGADAGVWGMNPGDASPFFVETLAAWMRLVGVSPAAGLFLNLSAYTALCVLVVRVFEPRNDWRADLPCAVGVATFTFSPVALLHGTQSMKEDMFALLIALVCLGLLWVTQALVFAEPAGGARRRYVAGLLLLAVAGLGISGIRAYYTVIVWLALGFTLTAFACTHRAYVRTHAIRYASGSLLVLGAIWLAYWQGSGPQYRGPRLTSAPAPAGAIEALQQVRTGFAAAGGETNMVPNNKVARARPPATANGPKATIRAPEVIPPPDAGQAVLLAARATSVGIAAEFVPISLLKAANVVTFSGGRGLLPIADLDTIFLDVSLATCLVILYRRRSLIGRRLPFVVCLLALSALTACLLAYVVTNFGSLFRLKTMVAVPTWLLCLAVSPRRPGLESPGEDRRTPSS
jgi:hypothetical protein